MKTIWVRFEHQREGNQHVEDIATSVALNFEEHQFNNERNFRESFMAQLMPQLVGYVMDECQKALRTPTGGE